MANKLTLYNIHYGFISQKREIKSRSFIDRLLQNTNFSHFSICKSLKLRNLIFKKLSFVTACRLIIKQISLNN